MKLLLTFLLISFSFVLFSCSDDSQPQPFNSYGGADRDNNYEHLGTFSTNMFATFALDCPDSSPAAVAPLFLDDKQFYISTVNGSVALIDDLKSVWIANIGAGKIAASDMAADARKNLYLITNLGEVQSYTHDGKLRWEYTHPAFIDSSFVFDDLLAQRDGLLVSASPGLLFKLSFDGKLKWQYSHSLATTQSFCADDAGNIALPSTHNDFLAADTLHFISPDGKLKWKKSFERTRILKTPVAYDDLIIYPASYMLGDNRLFLLIALDTTGKERWRKELNIMPKYISAGHDGRIYLLAYNSGYGETMSGIFCFDTAGKLLWKFYTANTVTAPLMISKDNIAFFGVKRNTAGVFFINRDGTVYHTVSLSDAPPLNHKPFATNSPCVAFTGSDKLFILKIDDSIIDRIFPW